MTRYLLLCLGVGLLLSCDSRIAVSSDALVVRNGTIIDGTGAPPLVDAVVVIQGRPGSVGGGPRQRDFRIPGESNSSMPGAGP